MKGAFISLPAWILVATQGRQERELEKRKEGGGEKREREPEKTGGALHSPLGSHFLMRSQGPHVLSPGFTPDLFWKYIETHTEKRMKMIGASYRSMESERLLIFFKSEMIDKSVM